MSQSRGSVGGSVLQDPVYALYTGQVYEQFQRIAARLAVLCLLVLWLLSLGPGSAYVQRLRSKRCISHISRRCVTVSAAEGQPSVPFSTGDQERENHVGNDAPNLTAFGLPDAARDDHNTSEEGVATVDGTSQQTPCYLRHEPVLLQETLDLLVTNPDGRYLDATLGYGGHSEAILERLSDKGSLVALDRDPEAVYYTGRRLSAYVDSGQMRPVIGTFSNLKRVLESHALPLTGYTGIVADLGLSTHQLESACRGFSYNTDGPLDMRMSNPLHDPFSTARPTGVDLASSLGASNTAFKIVNKARENELAHILKAYGEEVRAAVIARRIVDMRSRKGRISTTKELRDIVVSCVRGNHKAAMKVLSRVFQALRIYVNDELSELQSLLEFAPSLLHRKHGRFVVISYHSLEDRAVKRAFAGLQSASELSPDSSVYRVLTKKCVTAGSAESKANQKSRSAKLRCLQRSRQMTKE
ncbi:S-adenosyl methyltransferase, putative [Babesia bigemina]|uniref:S-adenosyl methyltransferase, putative n=1 Tax=Babesia bigemina TaxID=5866 RepID=A0A061DCK1_BABBI|nr:S-adenosyl methyltransferase, putative [Babesia bigemina]CDR97827.1 S-adenosyl methyltransferase, putative [Babesia bigemina]|eukprot:XP_012770013.1 S-adenosyl methyltransferase, putative [Babesia bigemina]